MTNTLTLEQKQTLTPDPWHAASGCVIAALMTTLVAACGDDVETAETVAGVSAALKGGGVQDDTGSAEANVVVSVNWPGVSCSGTLLTPQIVVTAAHCVWGEPAGCFSSPQVGTVQIGPINGQGPIFRGVAVDAASVCDSLFGSDVALLYLDQPVTAASMRAKQPTGTLPAVPRIYPATFQSPGGAMFGVAGFGLPDASKRHVKYFLSEGLDHEIDGGDGSYWRINLHDWETGNGDSGGALFTMNPDGTRHLVGVVHGRSYPTIGPNYIVFTDITRPGMDGWVSARISEGTVPSALRHSDPWLARHGKTQSDRWGHADYSGPCLPESDQDCDGWFDLGDVLHDNCPATPNSDQLDSDDDNIGDACARSGDSDDSALAAEDKVLQSVWVDGRQITLHVSHPNAKGWASIAHGAPGDSVWLDRSNDNGQTWRGLLGTTWIAASDSATQPRMFSYVGTLLRACGMAQGGSGVACTAWLPACEAHSCDGTDPAIVSSSVSSQAVLLWNRQIRLHKADGEDAAWASIENGASGDEVWLDRRWNGVPGLEERLSATTIPSGRTGWRTWMFSQDKPAYGVHGWLRACAKTVDHYHIRCTPWTRSWLDTSIQSELDPSLEEILTDDGVSDTLEPDLGDLPEPADEPSDTLDPNLDPAAVAALDPEAASIDPELDPTAPVGSDALADGASPPTSNEASTTLDPTRRRLFP